MMFKIHFQNQINSNPTLFEQHRAKTEYMLGIQLAVFNFLKQFNYFYYISINYIFVKFMLIMFLVGKSNMIG